MQFFDAATIFFGGDCLNDFVKQGLGYGGREKWE
jgi:hypothetical protein